MKTLLSFTVALCVGISARGADIIASSNSVADVQTAVNSAATGDVVIVPNGSATWTTTLDFGGRAITVRAETEGGVTLTYSVTGAALVTMTQATSSGTVARLSGFNITQGTGSYAWGVISVTGSDLSLGGLRIDHCTFTGCTSFQIVSFGAVGVIDHCTFDPAPAGTGIPIYVFHSEWGGTSLYADGSWAAAVDWTDATKWLTVEDCTCTWVGKVYAIIDSYRGARYVVRNCTLNNAITEAHGTESGQRFRGTRAVIVANNIANFDLPVDSLADIRSGTGRIYGNTINLSGDAFINSTAKLAAYRIFFPFPPWGVADGTNAWDLNDAAAGVYFTGTHTGANNATVLTDSGAAFTEDIVTDGCVVRNVTTGRSSFILSRTGTTIAYYYEEGYDPISGNLQFDTGDTYEVRRVIQSLDQAGAGQSDLMTAYEPTPVWLNQGFEPVHVWGNTTNTVGSGSPTIRSGESYIIGAPDGFTAFAYPHPLIAATEGTTSEATAATINAGTVTIGTN